MTIQLDTNSGEDAVFAELQNLVDLDNLRRQRLDIGDAHLTVAEGRRIVVERKTFNDFVASLRDKRYNEQKIRLMAERERSFEAGVPFNIVYVIEGRSVPGWDAKTAHMPNNQPLAALTKMAVRDGIAVLYTATPADTARQIAYLYKAGCDLAKGGFNSQAKAHMVAASGYAATCGSTNKHKAAEASGTQIMLATVNGCSGATAQAISERFPSVASLVRAYDEAGPAAAERLLADILLPNKRRLGPALSARVYAAVCGEHRWWRRARRPARLRRPSGISSTGWGLVLDSLLPSRSTPQCGPPTLARTAAPPKRQLQQCWAFKRTRSAHMRLLRAITESAPSFRLQLRPTRLLLRFL